LRQGDILLDPSELADLSGESAMEVKMGIFGNAKMKKYLKYKDFL